MSKFQLIITAIFGFLIVGALISFTLLRGGGKDVASVLIWGSISKTDFGSVLDATGISSNKSFSVTYVEVQENKIESAMINAMAENRGPDIVIMPQSMITKNTSKLMAIPYSSFAERAFTTKFIDGASVFLGSRGVIALPIYADPIIMYWNKRLFSNAGLVQPPKTWTELQNIVVPLLSRRTENNVDVSQSAVALGTWDNIKNAKGIISTLLLQAGTRITTTSNGAILNVINENRYKTSLSPVFSTFTFYTDYANPTKANYSWNNAKESDKTDFLAENLAIYFGRASEYAEIKEKNPNLLFDIAPVPQLDNSRLNSVHADFYGMAPTRSVRNLTAAFNVMSLLMSDTGARYFAEHVGMAPVTRSMVAKAPGDDPFKGLIYNQAIIARDWVNPDQNSTNNALREAIRSINSGRASVSEAVNTLTNTMSAIMNAYVTKY